MMLLNNDKQTIWEQYHAGHPSRVPVMLGMNNRVYLLDPRFNTNGHTYQDIFNDPAQMLATQLHWQELTRTHYHRFCDYPTGLPDKWQVSAHFQNVYEAWFFGCPLRFKGGQIPDTSPILTNDNKRAVFDVNIEHPLERDPCKRGIEFTERMMELARGYEYQGRPIEVLPYLPIGSDGPFTVALNLRGIDWLTDLVLDPDYADELMAFITRAAINRAQAVLKYWGKELQEVALADDSVEMISAAMYAERVLPHHQNFYNALDPENKLLHKMHLCGDDARHFPTIVRACHVRSIDTGFPVDFAWLRKHLGTEVEILGGVEVGLMMNGTPAQIYERAREILTSGVLEGKRFVLREANNLPPATPEQNLAALYQAALDWGRYE